MLGDGRSAGTGVGEGFATGEGDEHPAPNTMAAPSTTANETKDFFIGNYDTTFQNDSFDSALRVR